MGTRGYYLLHGLAKLGQRCVLVTSDSHHLESIAPLKKAYEDEAYHGVHVRRVKTFKHRSARDWRRVISWFHFEWRVVRMPMAQLPKPDVVIASSLSILSIFSGLYFKKKFGAKLVFEVRDIWPLVLVEEGGFSSKNPLIAFCAAVERFAYRKADVVVGTMPNLAAHVEAVIGRRIAVECVPMGVDPSTVNESAPLPIGYSDAFIPKGRFIVCHAGTIGVTNALDTLFECARLMRDDGRIAFLIVGDGYMRAHYQRLAADLGNVFFAPKIPKLMVQSLLEEVDLVYFSTHPSKVLDYGQSLNKVVDYMLSGKPVIGSFSGFPSMINEAGCGTFVPAADPGALADEIYRIYDKGEVARREMGIRGREWILKNRRYEKLAADYLEIFRKLLVDKQ